MDVVFPVAVTRIKGVFGSELVIDTAAPLVGGIDIGERIQKIDAGNIEIIRGRQYRFGDLQRDRIEQARRDLI